MASSLLTEYNVQNAGVVIWLTVFNDGVKVEVEEWTQRRCIGWFWDEVSALGAVCEREMMRSAILPELRRLPVLTVQAEYRTSGCGRGVDRFRRGTVSKRGPLGRRVVLLPGASAKPWLSS